MARLKFSAAPLLALAILAAPAAADPRSAANALFDDPVEREAFFAMMTADPKLAAAVAAVEAKAGTDPKAAAAALSADPAAAGWRKSVLDQLTTTRTALAQGMKTNRADYSKTAPLVAPLIDGLHKKSPADLYIAVNLSLAKHAPAAPAATKPACASGTRKAMDQLHAAAGGEMSSVTGECTEAPAVVSPAPPVKDPKDVLTPPGQVPAAVTDQRTTTGAPPAPGADKQRDGGGGGGGFFSSLPWGKIGLGAGFGGMLGLAMGFGTPLGVVGAGLVGAVIGAVLFSGVIGKLFGGGNSGS